MSKTTYYSIAVVVLFAVNLSLLFSDNLKASRATTAFFDSEDLAGVSKISFFLDENSVVIEKTSDGWVLNDNYAVDESFFNTLLSVLQRIEIVRKIEGWKGEQLGNAEIEFDFNSRYRFAFTSNPTETKSYFIQEGEAIQVTVPGYRDNVVDIFMLHPDKWRNRLVFDGSWRTIQKLEISRKDSGPLEIVFDDKFFLVNGNPPQDSSRVVDYLNQFQYFEANEMISEGRFPRLDSLAKTEPFASIQIEDIKIEETVKLNIYRNLKGQGYHLVTNEDKMMVIDAERVRGLLPSSQDFLSLK